MPMAMIAMTIRKKNPIPTMASKIPHMAVTPEKMLDLRNSRIFSLSMPLCQDTPSPQRRQGDMRCPPLLALRARTLGLILIEQVFQQARLTAVLGDDDVGAGADQAVAFPGVDAAPPDLIAGDG